MSHLLLAQWKAMTSNEEDFMIKSSQLPAFFMQTLDDISWAGFYWMKKKSLITGCYQGPVACTRIDSHRGVCGKCFTTEEIQIIDDVNQFDDHIACDTNSNSEVVVPLRDGNHILGVFDIDSYSLNRFDTDLSQEINLICEDFMKTTDLSIIKHWASL